MEPLRILDKEGDFQTSLAPSTATEADSLTKNDWHLSENGTFNYEYFFDAETVSKIQVINDENENENEYENELFQESENIENEPNWQKSILILRQYEETPESEITTGIAKPEITSQALNVSIPKANENENEKENEITATTKSMRTSKANWFRPIYTSNSDGVATESEVKTTEEESEMTISSSAISMPYYYDVEHETLEVTDDKEMPKFNSSKSALLNKVEITPRSIVKTNVTETDLTNIPSSKNAMPAKFKLNIIKTVESRITFDFEKISALGMKENVTVVELLEEKATTPSSRSKIAFNVTSVSTLFNALGTQPLNRTINRKIETVPLFKKQNLTSEENEIERVDQLTTKAETNSLLVLNTTTNDTDRKTDSTKELLYEIRNVTLVAEISRMEPFGVRCILLIFLTIFLASFLMTCGCLIVMKVCVRRQLNSYSVKKLSIKDLNNEASIHLPFADDLPGTAGIRNLQNEVYDDLDDILKKLEGCSQTSDDFCSQCCPQEMPHKK